MLTTIFTGLFRRWAETGAVWLGRKTRWRWLNPFKLVGQYGPKENDFRCKWYWAQLVQAVLLIGLPARMCALLIIFGSLAMPKVVSPVYHIASGWFHSGLTCEQQTAFILYVIPLTGDAVQFIIIDKLQAFGFLTHEGGVRDFENLEVRQRPADDAHPSLPAGPPPCRLRTATRPGLTHRMILPGGGCGIGPVYPTHLLEQESDPSECDSCLIRGRSGGIAINLRSPLQTHQHHLQPHVQADGEA